MNNEHENFTPAPNNELPNDRQPIGFWLRVVESQLTQAFASEFAADGIDRREWMLLKILGKADDADVDNERLARVIERSKKRGGKVLRRLAERGWVIESEGAWTLTDEGRAQRDALAARVDAIRAKVTESVSPEDYATTIASLESIARHLGWDGNERMPRGPRGFGRRGARGFGHGHAHRFGPEQGFGPRERCGEREDFGAHGGFGPRDAHHAGPHHDGSHHGHHEHGDAGHGRHGQRSEQAYERGFEAGVAAASRLNVAS